MIFIFALFVGALVVAYIHVKIHKEVYVEEGKETLELARHYEEQLNLVSSHYTLGKITDDQYKDLCKAINDNALQYATKKLEELEK